MNSSYYNDQSSSSKSERQDIYQNQKAANNVSEKNFITEYLLWSSKEKYPIETHFPLLRSERDIMEKEEDYRSIRRNR